MKVTPQEIKECLENGTYTQSALADEYGVSKDTIKDKIRRLREDGEPIIHSEKGMTIISRESLNDQEISEAFRVWFDWLMKVVKGMMICAKPTRPLLPALRKQLKESMSPAERKELNRSCVTIKGLLDYVEVQQEDE